MGRLAAAPRACVQHSTAPFLIPPASRHSPKMQNLSPIATSPPAAKKPSECRKFTTALRLFISCSPGGEESSIASGPRGQPTVFTRSQNRKKLCPLAVHKPAAFLGAGEVCGYGAGARWFVTLSTRHLGGSASGGGVQRGSHGRGSPTSPHACSLSFLDWEDCGKAALWKLSVQSEHCGAGLRRSARQWAAAAKAATPLCRLPGPTCPDTDICAYHQQTRCAGERHIHKNTHNSLEQERTDFVLLLRQAPKSISR